MKVPPLLFVKVTVAKPSLQESQVSSSSSPAQMPGTLSHNTLGNFWNRSPEWPRAQCRENLLALALWKSRLPCSKRQEEMCGSSGRKQWKSGNSSEALEMGEVSSHVAQNRIIGYISYKLGKACGLGTYSYIIQSLSLYSGNKEGETLLATALKWGWLSYQSGWGRLVW